MAVNGVLCRFVLPAVVVVFYFFFLRVYIYLSARAHSRQGYMYACKHRIVFMYCAESARWLFASSCCKTVCIYS